ncbi:MAG: hypothetical protein ACRDJC_00765 [Thermomicrobiales bacterium]
MDATLFGAGSERDSFNTFHSRLKAFASPIAVDVGAIVEDSDWSLLVAEAVYDAFGDLDQGRGLTRVQLVEQCLRVHPDPVFVEERIGVFIRMGMLQLSKRSQQRYQFNPDSVAGLMVYDRLGEEGGVQELLSLLDRTRASIENGTATQSTVATSLDRARRAFAIHTGFLNRLVEDRPLGELIETRRHHRAANQLLHDAKDLIEQVSLRHPNLAGAGDRLILEATRYTDAVQRMIDRLLQENTRNRDFSMLDPEQYRTAAQTSDRDALAVPFERVLFAPAASRLDAATILETMDAIRPRTVRVRPVREATLDVETDPLETARTRRERAKQSRIRRTENAIDAAAADDLTSVLRAAGWPGAGQLIADLIAMDADPEQPYALTMSESILVDPTGPVSYVTPVQLHRVVLDAATAAGDGLVVQAGEDRSEVVS